MCTILYSNKFFENHVQIIFGFFVVVLVYQMNLWRPPSDLQSLLKEGCRYKVYNLTTSDAKKHGGSTTVQLTGTKKTQFEEIQVRVRNKLYWAHNSYGIVDAVFIDGDNMKYL